MLNNDDLGKIKEITKAFLEKMTMTVLDIEIKSYSQKNKEQDQEVDVADINIKVEYPQFLIGQNGQTLTEFEKVLKMILHKKIENKFYVKADVDHYREQKVEYIKRTARDLADEVYSTGQSKTMAPMPAFERRLVHVELENRKDIIVESQGEGSGRYIIINPAK